MYPWSLSPSSLWYSFRKASNCTAYQTYATVALLSAVLAGKSGGLTFLAWNVWSHTDIHKPSTKYCGQLWPCPGSFIKRQNTDLLSFPRNFDKCSPSHAAVVGRWTISLSLKSLKSWSIMNTFKGHLLVYTFQISYPDDFNDIAVNIFNSMSHILRVFHHFYSLCFSL